MKNIVYIENINNFQLTTIIIKKLFQEVIKIWIGNTKCWPGRLPNCSRPRKYSWKIKYRSHCSNIKKGISNIWRIILKTNRFTFEIITPLQNFIFIYILYIITANSELSGRFEKKTDQGQLTVKGSSNWMLPRFKEP